MPQVTLYAKNPNLGTSTMQMNTADPSYPDFVTSGDWSTTPTPYSQGADPSTRGPLSNALKGQLTLRNANGQTQMVNSSDTQQVDALTRSGWTPLTPQGQPYRVVPYQGGQVFIDPANPGTPLNLTGLLTGQNPPDVQAQMPAFQQWLTTHPNGDITQDTSPGLQTYPPNTSNNDYHPGPTPAGDPGGVVSPSGLASGSNFSGLDYQGLIAQLIAESLQQGQQGQASVQPTVNSLTDALMGAGSLQKLTGNPTLDAAMHLIYKPTGGVTDAQMADIRDAYTAGSPALMHALNGMSTSLNDTQGLSSGAMAALNTNAMDSTARSYNDASGALASELLRSGAVGAQDGSGGAQQLIAGYGGLESNRIGQQSNLISQMQLANAQAQQQNYNTAQSTGVGALGQLSSLSGGLSNAYLQNAGLGLQGWNANNATAVNAASQSNQQYNALINSLLQGSNQAAAAGQSGIQNASQLMAALGGRLSGNTGTLNAIIGAIGSTAAQTVPKLIP